MNQAGSSFHAYGRAAAADISRGGEKFFHGYHLRFFVAGNLGGFLEVNFAVAGYYAYEETCAVTAEHKRLEHAFDRFAETFRDMVGGEVIGIHLVWHQSVCHAFSVKNPGGIGLFSFGMGISVYMGFARFKIEVCGQMLRESLDLNPDTPDITKSNKKSSRNNK